MNTPASRPARKHLLFKLRVIYLPFLFIAVGFIVLYTLVDWVCFIRTGSTSVSEDLLHLWLPILLPWIPVLLWLRPRIKLLRLQSGSGNWPTVYLLIAVAAMSVPTIIAQKYLTTATGELTALKTPRKVDRRNTTKYYTIENYFADKDHAALAYSVHESGKRNQYLNFQLYFAVPIYDKKDVLKLNDLSPFFEARYEPAVMVDGEVVDSADVPSIRMDSVTSIYMLGLRAARIVYGREAWNGAIFIEKEPANYDAFKAPSEIHKFSPKVWMGVNYSKQISNHLSEEEQYQAYVDFVDDAIVHFKERALEGFAYLDRIGNTEERKGYALAIKESNYYDVARPLVLVPVYEPFKDRNGNKLGWIFGSFGIGAGLFLLLVLVPRLQARSLRALRRGKASTQTELKELLALVVPRGEFFVTPIIMHLNIAVFLVMVFAGLGFDAFSGEDALRWGGNFRPLTAEGEWWRLVSSMFLHGGVLHLVANMVGLMFVSVFLEPLLGRGRFVIAYLLSGVAGSLASILWHPATVSVGASGAIFGLYGVFLALLLARVFPRETNKAFLVSTALFVGYNLLMGLGGGIDNAAHMGGLVMGLLLGAFVCPLFKKEKVAAEEAFDFETPEQAEEEEAPAAQEERV